MSAIVQMEERWEGGSGLPSNLKLKFPPIGEFHKKDEGVKK